MQDFTSTLNENIPPAAAERESPPFLEKIGNTPDQRYAASHHRGRVPVMDGDGDRGEEFFKTQSPTRWGEHRRGREGGGETETDHVALFFLGPIAGRNAFLPVSFPSPKLQCSTHTFTGSQGMLPRIACGLGREVGVRCPLVSFIFVHSYIDSDLGAYPS